MCLLAATLLLDVLLREFCFSATASDFDAFAFLLFFLELHGQCEVMVFLFGVGGLRRCGLMGGSAWVCAVAELSALLTAVRHRCPTVSWDRC